MPARGSSLQPSLAAAPAREAAHPPPPPHTTASRAVAITSPARAAASASGAVEPNGPYSKTSLRPVACVTQEAATAAGMVSIAGNPSLLSAVGSEQPAVVGRQEDASSSASFDSWHSRNREDSTTTASTSQPADVPAGRPSRHPGSNNLMAAADFDAQGTSVNTHACAASV